jgi:pimeloyl-ACP methyl ester carboxylesterase
MPTVEGAGVELRYEERGPAGAPGVLLLHGMAATAAGVAPLAEALAARARVVRYDRRGYGGSGSPEPYSGTTVEEQGEDAAAVLRRLDLAPAVVAGVGFGALVALDLLHRHRALVRGAVLAEPPLLQFVPEATEALAQEHGRINEAVHVGGPAAGVRVWLGTEPPPDAVRGFFADYAGLATLALGRRDLRALVTPAVVVTAPDTPPLVARAAEAVAALLPAAGRRTDGDVAAAVTDLLP